MFSIYSGIFSHNANLMFLSVDLKRLIIDGITSELKSAGDNLAPMISIGFKAFDPAPPNCKDCISSGNKRC